MDIVSAWLDGIEGWFVTHQRVFAVILGLLAALIVAQFAKLPLAILFFDEGVRLRDDSERVQTFRWLVRLIGAIAATAAVVLIWPANGSPWLPWVLGVVLGGVAHPVYRLVTIFAAHRWPWLAVTKPGPTLKQRFDAAVHPKEADHDGLDGELP